MWRIYTHKYPAYLTSVIGLSIGLRRAFVSTFIMKVSWYNQSSNPMLRVLNVISWIGIVVIVWNIEYVSWCGALFFLWASLCNKLWFPVCFLSLSCEVVNAFCCWFYPAVELSSPSVAVFIRRMWSCLLLLAHCGSVYVATCVPKMWSCLLCL